jgi:glutamine synthetase
MMKFKYVVKNTAWEQRQDRDLHAEADLRRQRLGHAHHQSLWKDGEPLFYDERGYGGLSDMARWYIGGLLKHAPRCWPSPTRR